MDKGDNKNYYLCIEYWVITISPMYFQNDHIRIINELYDEGLTGFFDGEIAGGVQVLELCYYSDYSGRGHISSDNTGSNENYYLHTNKWYYSLSPMHFFSNDTNAMINIKKEGFLQSAYTGHIEGGVQVLELCY